MRVECQRFSSEVADFATHLNINPGDENNAEKLELLKKFVEFLDANKHGFKHKMHKHGHGHGRHGMFKHFGKHGHGKHGHGKHGKHGGHGPFGRHGYGGPHHGHHGFKHGHHGHHFGHHGFHGHHGKFKAQWCIDLTQEEQDNNLNTQLVLASDIRETNQASASTANNEGQTGVMNCSKCQCTGFERRHCRGSGRWRLCPYRRNISITQDNACQTDEPVNNENIEQENLSAMVESINIENTE